MGIRNRMKQFWSAFGDNEPYSDSRYAQEPWQFKTVRLGGSSEASGRIPLSVSTERTTVSAIYNRIALDVASLEYRHIKVDMSKDEQFEKIMDSSLNDCLQLDANIDQTWRQLVNSAVQTMFDKGVVAFVPVDMKDDPDSTGTHDVRQIRAGVITGWFPDSIAVDCYNESTGLTQQITVKKEWTSIVENPFFTIMNTPNSTVKRLITKLNQLDMVDKQSSSGKLDLIIQVPYQTKSELNQKRAEKRRTDLEDQLRDSTYGVAYIDGTERVIQLNRAIENNLMSQIEFLTGQLFSQLGITTAILDGSADEQTMTNYYSRIVDLIATFICEGCTKAWISKTGRTQGQRVEFFRDPFKIVSPTNFAELSDKMTRNAILSSNEVRGKMGLKPSSDPDADALRNKNLNMSENDVQKIRSETDPEAEQDKNIKIGGNGDV